jgi:hypothetical protein
MAPCDGCGAAWQDRGDHGVLDHVDGCALILAEDVLDMLHR